MKHAAILASLVLALLSGPAVADTEDLERLSMDALMGTPAERQTALDTIIERGGTDMLPTLVRWMRISGNNVQIARALKHMTGEDLPHWRDAAVWLERRPEITAHPSYKTLQMRFWANTDERFRAFIDQPDGTPWPSTIRFEEIQWGGVLVDGIIPLDRPPMIPASEAGYLLDDDLVFGVKIGDDVRAYPIRIMGWHEMMNDVVGGVPVSLAYCTLCGSGILYDTRVEGREPPFEFSTSGLLYRSNKLMYDRETQSLWRHFTGKPAVGPLVGSGIELTALPMATTTWANWRERHPETTVLSLETGFVRNYGSGVTYRDYFASPDLMFPAYVRDESRVRRKDIVFGLTAPGQAKAWPIDAFAETPVINDRFDGRDIVLIGNADSRAVRAYQRDGQTLSMRDGKVFSSDGAYWNQTEAALVGPGGERLERIVGQITYWFAWDNHLGLPSAFYRP